MWLSSLNERKRTVQIARQLAVERNLDRGRDRGSEICDPPLKDWADICKIQPSKWNIPNSTKYYKWEMITFVTKYSTVSQPPIWWYLYNSLPYHFACKLAVVFLSPILNTRPMFAPHLLYLDYGAALSILISVKNLRLPKPSLSYYVRSRKGRY